MGKFRARPKEGSMLGINLGVPPPPEFQCLQEGLIFFCFGLAVPSCPATLKFGRGQRGARRRLVVSLCSHRAMGKDWFSRDTRPVLLNLFRQPTKKTCCASFAVWKAKVTVSACRYHMKYSHKGYLPLSQGVMDDSIGILAQALTQTTVPALGRPVQSLGTHLSQDEEV